jgi:hypothetical protein
MAYTDNASLGFGVALAFTPASGVGVGVAVALDAIMEVTPPGRNSPPVMWTPLDGTQAGMEQAVAGEVKVTESSLKCAYTAARYAILEALNRIAGTYVLTLNDGRILTGINTVMTKITQSQITGTALQAIEMTFSVPGGWTSTGGIVSDLTATMTAGAVTVDLTAAPTTGTGKKVQAITFLALATNANQITIAKGASSGCDNLGAHFSVTLAPGQQTTVYMDTAATAISSSNKNLDVSGTLAQAVQMHILTV